MSSTVVADVTTKTGCRVRLLKANHGEYDHLGPGLMLTLAVPENNQRAEVYLDTEALREIWISVGRHLGYA